MRLIDADALLKALKANCGTLCNDKNTDWCEYCCPHNDFEDLIDNAPTVFDCRSCKHNGNEHECIDCHDYSNFVKYEERPQGEWVIDGHHYKCSRCGKTLAIMFSETDDDDLIGCPFCLADMRGGRE